MFSSSSLNEFVGKQIYIFSFHEFFLVLWLLLSIMACFVLCRENTFLSLSEDTNKNLLKACFSSWILSVPPDWLVVDVHLLAIGLPQLSGGPWSSYHILQMKKHVEHQTQESTQHRLVRTCFPSRPLSSVGILSAASCPRAVLGLCTKKSLHLPATFLTWVSLLPGLSVNTIPSPSESSINLSKSLLWIYLSPSCSQHLEKCASFHSMLPKPDGIYEEGWVRGLEHQLNINWCFEKITLADVWRGLGWGQKLEIKV